MMELLLDKQPIDPSRIVLGGFSQGAGMAILLSLETSLRCDCNLPARGFIAVSPSIRGFESHFQPGELLPHRSPDTLTLRGYLITGGQDSRQDMFQQITQTLADRGVTYQHEDHPDLGHEYPDDFPASLGRAIQFILD
jgi:predicted esterase